MKGDFTRFTHLPAKHYSRVLKQQGRVDLDADWNEAAEIQAWSQHIQGVDVIGACGVPKIGGGFAVSNLTSDGTDFSLSTGRIYVDGLLCQLDDPQKATYLSQPDLPEPQALQPVDQQTDLVYLYVWERHIIAQQDPDLLEVALGGPDTTTRVKTICQVRVAPNVGAGNCDTFKDWGLPASDGRLTVETGEVDGGDPDACAITPLGGYTGLENRLYRVEIHDGSQGGAPTFKWSRDNGSVVFAVEEFFPAEPKKVRLKSLGHDQILELALGNWIEVSDDASELAGRPGTLAQITDLDVANRILTLSADLSGYSLDFYPIARRWDQASGPIPVAAGPIALEAGIQVRFSGTTYQTGDYWTFTARTATGDVQRLTDAPGQGIAYHTCVLALIHWKKDGTNWKADIEDCRPFFPALANLAAEDVAFDNANCKLPGADNVQEALDRLCESRDLRHHNKHLHGWGIVCGLQVNCGPDEEQIRQNVTVKDGYAIDCEGNDLLIEEEIIVNVLDRIAALDAADPQHPILDQNGDGEMCLSLELDENLQVQIGAERYQPDGDLQSLLSGTLLMDFYNDCLKAPVEAIRALLTPQPGEEKLPVGPTEKRLRTILNLAIQISDPQHGGTVYLSLQEDQILRELYKLVRGLLQSHTFCAMFDNARQFPDYPFPEHKINTIFGKGLHTRLRLHPSGRFAYTLGQGTSLNVFDLQKEEMLAVVEVPGGAGIQVQDVACSQDGKTLYAIATINQNDTIFATASIDAEKFTWQPVTMICDIKLVTLVTAFSLAKDQVYAIGEQKGLYLLNPNNLPTDPQPLVAFAAVGHLEINEELKRAYATASSKGTQVYDQVYDLDLSQAAPPANFFSLVSPDGKPLTGEAGLTLVSTKDHFILAVEATLSTAPATKGVCLFTVPENKPQAVVPVENATLSLEAIPRTSILLVASRTSNWVQAIDAVAQKMLEDFRLPVQISPVAMVATEKGDQVIVLNSTSGTLNLIPKEYFLAKKGSGPKPQAGSQEFLDALVDYRVGVLEAYSDLTGAALQYVKDCLFDHFLVNCPDCTPQQKIYLACVSVRSRQVYKVCNYSKRKYVKSFPLLGYWFSLVPVMPFLDKAIEQLACMVLPDLFGKYVPPRPEQNKATIVSGESVGRGLAYLATNNLRQNLVAKGRQIGASRSLALDSIKAGISQAAAPRQVVEQADLVGRPVEDARQKMEAANVGVAGVETYDPRQGLSNVIRFTQAPPVVQPGTRVTLYEENGVVRYYSVESGAVQNLRAEVNAQQGALAEVQTLKTTVSELQNGLAARDKELEALRGQVKDLQAGPAPADLQKATQRVANLEAELQDLRKFRDQVTQFMEKSSKPGPADKPNPPAKPDK
jgi:hypothetical protein